MIKTTITIDKFLTLQGYPNYCRNGYDIARWFTWKLGHLNNISPNDEVTESPERCCYIVERYHKD